MDFAMERDCTATVTCSASFALSPSYQGTIMKISSTNVVECQPNSAMFGIDFMFTRTFMTTLLAKAMTYLTGFKNCGWAFGSTMSPVKSILGISSADGLPVELLEFVVDSEDAESR